MLKSELIAKLVEVSKLKKIDCENFMNSLSTVLLDILKSKESVPLGNFGQFKYKKSAPRTCKMIKSNEVVEIPSRGGVSFAPSKSTKEILSKIV